MELIRVANGTPTPITLRQLRGDNPTVSFPSSPSAAALAPFDVFIAQVATPPAAGPLETAVRRSEAALTDGVWVYEWDLVPLPLADRNALINAERDRRLLLGKGFTPTGHGAPVKVNALDEPNLNGLATLAVVQAGAGNGSATVQWRDNDDVLHTLTFNQMIELYGLAAAYKQAVYAASWTIKGLDPVPTDYTDDSRWPPT